MQIKPKGSLFPLFLPFIRSKHFFLTTFILLFLPAFLLTSCNFSLKNTSQSKSIYQTTNEQEVLVCYTPKMVQQEIDHFDNYTTFLVSDSMRMSPLSASFKYADLEALGLDYLNSELDDFSSEYLKKEIDYSKNVINDLENMDYDLLTNAQQVTYDMLLYLNQLAVDREPFMYYEAVIEPSSGLQTNLLLSLIQIELKDPDDVEAYFTRLSQLPRLMNQVITYENIRAEHGLLLPPEIYNAVILQINAFLKDPEKFIIYESFCQSLDNIDTLNQAEKDSYRNECLLIVENTIYPAYANLKTAISNISSLSTVNSGVCSYLNGKAYYNYLIKKETSYDMDGDELKSWVLQEITNAINEIKQLYADYPELLTIEDSNFLPTYNSIDDLYNIEAQCLDDLFYDYDIERAAQYTIPSYLEDYVAAGFYFPVSIDGNSYGNMYLQGDSYENIDASTLELYFHENIPGHHLYFSKLYSSDLPLIRKVNSWLPYEEGWAQYIQNFCIDYYELSEPMSRLLKLVNKLSYYYMLRLDISYHYEGLSYTDALNNYKSLGYSDIAAKKALNRMVANPCEIIHYIYGAYKMESYLELCKNELGNKFDIKSFHDMLLNNAGLPFTTMDDIVVDYIDACK